MSEHLVTGQRSRTHIWLVYHAGSLSKTEVEGERSKEAKFTEKSLSALGDVISSLASKTPTCMFFTFFFVCTTTDCMHEFISAYVIYYSRKKYPFVVLFILKIVEN